MEKITLTLNGKDNMSIKRGDTQTKLDFSLRGKDNKGMSLVPSRIQGITFVIQDTAKENEAITIQGSDIKVDGNISLQLSEEFYENLNDKKEFALEAHILFIQDDDTVRKGIYPMDGYFNLTIMDSLL